MGTVLTALIEKLPGGYIQIMLPLLTAFLCVYVLPRIRRDKQGRYYLYSQRYEDGKRNRKQDAILEELRTMKTDLMKLQILSSELAPNTKLTIYDEYKKTGGNSYIDAYVRDRVLPSVAAHTDFVADALAGREGI